jgi:hypothetical protein
MRELSCTGQIDSVPHIHHRIFDSDAMLPWWNDMCRNGKHSGCSLASGPVDASAMVRHVGGLGKEEDGRNRFMTETRSGRLSYGDSF